VSISRRRIALLLAIFLLSSAFVSASRAAAQESPPSCLGHTATVWGSGELEGTEGDDVIVGSNAADIINGYGGDDIICGLARADIINGGPGRDRIRGGLGKDVIDGGEDGDVIRGGIGHDTISGGPGRDRLIGQEGRDWIDGGPDNDNIFGHSGPDVLIGGDGDDMIRGKEGDDELQGGPGNDELWGGDQDDYMFGDEGDDLLEGRGHHDLLYGGAGADTLRGNAGADELWGGECLEVGWRGDNHFCRATPSGRVADGTAAEEGDLLYGGRNFDACNCSQGVDCQKTDCETYRGWRGSPWEKETAEEWRDYVEWAFTAYGLEIEIEHAMQIIACESLGDPFQVTPPFPPDPPFSDLRVVGLFQHRMLFWSDRSAAAGVAGFPPYRPDINAWVAAWLVDFSIEWGLDPWHHWACYPLLVDEGLWEKYPEEPPPEGAAVVAPELGFQGLDPGLPPPESTYWDQFSGP
jgi:hypothetical protein